MFSCESVFILLRGTIESESLGLGSDRLSRLPVRQPTQFPIGTGTPAAMYSWPWHWSCCTTLQQPTIDSAARRKTRAEEKEKEKKKKKKVTFLHEPFIAVHSSGFGLAAKAT